MGNPLILGVDGGGSRTVALVADEAGRIVGRGVAAASNLHGAGAPAAQESVRAAVAGALAAAQLPPPPFAGACLGLAGAGRPAERALWQRWAAEEGLAAHPLVVGDSDLVLAAGTPEGWGLALIAGTGSIAWGRSPAGELARAGGWGYLLGDEGSGYAVGLAGLRAIALAADGRGPATALQETILAHLGLASPAGLVGHVYRPAVPRPEIAALAPLVERVSAEGDPVAQAIIAEAGRALALALDAVARRLGFGARPVPCALGGGFLVHGRLVGPEALRAAAALGWRLEPVARVPEPALGALRLARGEVPPPGPEWAADPP